MKMAENPLAESCQNPAWYQPKKQRATHIHTSAQPVQKKTVYEFPLGSKRLLNVLSRTFCVCVSCVYFFPL